MASIAICILSSGSDMRKNGTAPVYLRFTKNGRPKYISLGYKVRPEHFKPKGSKYIVSKSPNSARLNYLLTQEANKAQNIMLEIERLREPLTFENFKSKFISNDKLPVCETLMKVVNQKLKDKEIVEGTHSIYVSAIKKFRGIVGDIRFDEIEPNLLSKFKNEASKTSSEYTGNFYLKLIKSFFEEAIEKYDIRTNDSFSSVKITIPKPEKKKDDLNGAEIDLLLNTFNDWRHKKKYLSGFSDSDYEDLRKYLFSIFSGLRISDIVTLKFTHLKLISIDGSDFRYVKKKLWKNRRRGKEKEIPLNFLATDLIDFTKEEMLGRDALVFKSGKRNEQIKKFASALGIQKHLTYHTGRHTFSERTRKAGMPVDDIGEILGHSSATITREFYTSTNIEHLYRQLIKYWDMNKKISYSKSTISKSEKLRKNIATLRESRGLKPVDLCKKIGKDGISLSQYWRLENGESNMSLDFLMDICRVFEVSLAQLESGDF